MAKMSKGLDATAFRSSASLLIKLGSLIVHAEEFMSKDGHPLDKAAFDSVRGDPEVVAWFNYMNGMAFLPVKRKGC